MFLHILNMELYFKGHAYLGQCIHPYYPIWSYSSNSRKISLEANLKLLKESECVIHTIFLLFTSDV